jgi:hypothetical protein
MKHLVPHSRQQNNMAAIHLQLQINKMQHYQLILLSISLLVAYYCINFSTILTTTSSSIKKRRAKQLRRPLIFDYVYDNNKSSTTATTSTLKKDVVITNIQGTVPHPILRRNLGSLQHEHVGTKELGSIDNCDMTSNRIKHIIKSSASSIHWKEKGDNHPWMIWNDRGNSNQEIDTPKYQYVVIQDVSPDDDTGTITKIDNAVAVNNESITTKGEWMAQDPRVVMMGRRRIIIYHSKVQRQMWLYDDETKQAVMLTICGHGTDGMQKNWSPLVISDGILLLVYTLNPLVVLRYDVDKGDGVCTLVFGHLPLRDGMDEPYGGTPFVEIFSNQQKDGGGVVTRSFLSMAHSRRANEDLISPEKLKSLHSRRVYRPVPIVLHMFCVSSNDGVDEELGVDTLQGCTFGTDVYDMWHEVESPSFLLKTKWKKTERKQRSVSFPYDLHLFQDDNMIRVGLEYEDCYSVYEDYKVDFNTILERQLTHPLRVLLEMQHTNDVNNQHESEFMPALIQSTSTNCPAQYSNAGGEKLCATPMASEDDLARHINGRIWIVSHQYRHRQSQEMKALHKTLSPKQIGRKTKQLEGSQLDGILDHYPYPLQKTTEDDTPYAPTLCIYVYGSM